MSIVAGVLAPHPPHLVYAENPPQNEATSEGGWEMLRWGYERLRRDLQQVDYDVIVVHTPHWQTYVGTHFLGLPHFKNKSVDPIFPNLFRYNYEMDVDVELAEAISEQAAADGLVTKMMRNPDFRVDYGTITSCHLVRPQWDKPIVCMSSQRSSAFYNVDVTTAQATALGRATATAIDKLGRKALVLASNSLSHRHFTHEAPVPEDMTNEHVHTYMGQLWDTRLIEMMRAGHTRELVDIMPEYTEQAVSETDAGTLTWMLSALDFPTIPAELYAYGTVIGTGNAVVGWGTSPAQPRLSAGVAP